MRSRNISIIVVFSLFFALTIVNSCSNKNNIPPVTIAGQNIAGSDTAGGDVIVKFKNTISLEYFNQPDQKLDLDTTISHKLADLDSTSEEIWRIHSNSLSTAELTAKLKPLLGSVVSNIEPNCVIQADNAPPPDLTDDQWDLRSGFNGSIDAEGAWEFTTGSEEIVVGVLDTGIDYTHEDLKDNIWHNINGLGYHVNNLDINCPRYTNDPTTQKSVGFNAVNKTCDPMDDNNMGDSVKNFHGTHVAGTIGAVGNNKKENGTPIGIVGINWKVKLMALKCLNNKGKGTICDAIEAIAFAIRAKKSKPSVNIRIISCSWGFYPNETDVASTDICANGQGLYDVIKDANENGILFVASAGNDHGNNDDSEHPHYPSSYDLPNIISVAATDDDNALDNHSNWGKKTVHLGAPGVRILSTSQNNKYNNYDGTSAAAPHVSGAAALILSYLATHPSSNPSDLKPEELKDLILKNVDPFPESSNPNDPYNKVFSHGRLNVNKAINSIAAGNR